MLVINLYALQHSAGVSGENAELINTNQLSSDEKISRNCILDLIAGSLSALLLPVYTIKNAIVDYFALPTSKLKFFYSAGCKFHSLKTIIYLLTQA